MIFRNFRRKFAVASVLTAVALSSLLPPVVAQESAEEPVAIAPAPSPQVEEPSADPFAERETMLESLADSLSKRMDTIRLRERALDEREALFRKREIALEEREAAMTARETALDMRESLIRRREQLPAPHAWQGPPPPEVYAKHVAVIDGLTGQVYHLKAADQRTAVASTQKLLTALIVLSETGIDQEIEVPREVLQVEPTLIGIKPGQKYPARQLLSSLLIRSGNDVAACLAVSNAGSVAAFAEKMNLFGRSLGMEDSNFLNPHGLTEEGQYSTARDIAWVAFEAYQNPFVRETVKKQSYEFVFTDGSTRTLINTNRVLKSLSQCNGMKTGYTRASGHCLVSSASDGDRNHRIAVVIGSNSTNVWKDSQRLLEWALSLETS